VLEIIFIVYLTWTNLVYYNISYLDIDNYVATLVREHLCHHYRHNTPVMTRTTPEGVHALDSSDLADSSGARTEDIKCSCLYPT